MATILLVEDERGISDIVRAYLEKENYTVLQAFDGEEALQLFGSQPIDAVILDLMLPKIPGEEVCSRIRSRSDLPILMLTAKGDLDDKVAGFQLGADDYLSKPFEPRELIERIRALLRRARRGQPKAAVIALLDGTVLVYPETMRVTKDGEDIFLTTNEFKILNTLLSNPNKVFTREEIISLAFGMEYDAYDRAIDTHIKNIRAKLENDPRHPEIIKTVYGTGYKAVTPYDTAK